jgi:hypothetical protein
VPQTTTGRVTPKRRASEVSKRVLVIFSHPWRGLPGCGRHGVALREPVVNLVVALGARGEPPSGSLRTVCRKA